MEVIKCPIHKTEYNSGTVCAICENERSVRLLTIDGEKYEVEKPVADLIISVSEERDELKAKV